MSCARAAPGRLGRPSHARSRREAQAVDRRCGNEVIDLAMTRQDIADYLGLRILSTGLALSVIAGLAVWSHYPFWISAVIVMVGFAKGSESISDAIYGLVQWHERMDLIARSMMLRAARGRTVMRLLSHTPSLTAAR